MKIYSGNLDHAAVRLLLAEHLDSMRASSPPESSHALDLAGLSQPNVTFYSAWAGEALAGCAALKEIDVEHGEIKSMRTAENHLRKGVAAGLLTHIIEQARQRNYRRLSLETGSAPLFAPARKLYERFGFSRCAPFAEYRVDANSVFMTRVL